MTVKTCLRTLWTGFTGNRPATAMEVQRGVQRRTFLKGVGAGIVVAHEVFPIIAGVLKGTEANVTVAGPATDLRATPAPRFVAPLPASVEVSEGPSILPGLPGRWTAAHTGVLACLQMPVARLIHGVVNRRSKSREVEIAMARRLFNDPGRFAALVIVKAPLIEELLFRGVPAWLLNGCRFAGGGSGPLGWLEWAVGLGSASIFALGHRFKAKGYRPVNEFLVGAVAWWLTRTQNIFHAIGYHAAMNAVTVTMTVATARKSVARLTDEELCHEFGNKPSRFHGRLLLREFVHRLRVIPDQPEKRVSPHTLDTLVRQLMESNAGGAAFARAIPAALGEIWAQLNPDAKRTVAHLIILAASNPDRFTADLPLLLGLVLDGLEPVSVVNGELIIVEGTTWQAKRFPVSRATETLQRIRSAFPTATKSELQRTLDDRLAALLTKWQAG